MQYIEYTLLLSFFLTSLLGSAHCVSMCGGFASLCGGESVGATILRSTFYHLGRLTTYLLAAIGAVGIHLLIADYLIGFGLIVVGILLLFGVSLIPKSGTRLMGSAYRKALSLGDKKSVFFLFILGFSSTLLPCGWLYINLGVATASSHPILMMSVFWLGTLPFLTAWTTLSGSVLVRVGGWYPKIRATLLIAMGVFAIAQHTPSPTTSEDPNAHLECHHTE